MPSLGSKVESILLAAIVLLAAVGCGSPGTATFDALAAGMTEDDVRDLLGDPTVVVPARLDEDGTPLGGPRWQYGDTLSTVTTAAAFPDTVPDRVWVVWFDAEGRVMTWRAPVVEDRGADAAGHSDGEPIFADPAPPRNR